jgi:hypothetical protein
MVQDPKHGVQADETDSVYETPMVVTHWERVLIREFRTRSTWAWVRFVVESTLDDMQTGGALEDAAEDIPNAIRAAALLLQEFAPLIEAARMIPAAIPIHCEARLSGPGGVA